jgi:hypothetical protein
MCVRSAGSVGYESGIIYLDPGLHSSENLDSDPDPHPIDRLDQNPLKIYGDQRH